MRIIALAVLLIALTVALAGVNSGTAAAQSTTDYDDDDDGLIDVTTLAQLNAIRWDLNGDGDVAATNAANYLLAFPNRDTGASTRMGCPSGTCTGYELRANLDFDTDDDGDVDSNDDYPNWTPIGTATISYGAEFKGNNHTISNMTISGATTLTRIGLFGTLAGSGSISGVGLEDVNINLTSMPVLSVSGTLVGYSIGTVRSSYATGVFSATVASAGNLVAVGGLIGSSSPGTITTSWSSVDVSVAGTTWVMVGGLVGQFQATAAGASTTIIASYATGSVSNTATGSNVYAGGLVGYMGVASTGQATLTASYATGAVSVASTGTSGGLVGITHGTVTITDGYWDTGTTDIADDSDTTSPEGKTTSDLQSVLSYTGIYANWNVNVDGMAGNDDPWDFGTNMQYPRLKFDGMSLTAQQDLPIDYDRNKNGLIDVTTLAQLNAMRWDPNGDGDVASGDAANYLLAFPNRKTNAVNRMGCPSGTCTGYELRADLDFDTDNSGDVDSSDTYPSWTPLGSPHTSPYTAEFKGNNHTISNLTISGSTTLFRMGLFGTLSSTGSISGVGLVDVDINVALPGLSRGGALVGYNAGTVRSSYSTGSVTVTTTGAATTAGGLVGRNDTATVAASWSSADVSATGTASVIAGGLVGRLQASAANSSIIASYATGSVSATGTGAGVDAGGLVGYGIGAGANQAVITASYATGPVSASSGSSPDAGGVIGSVGANGTITDAYWDTTTSSISDDSDTTSPEGKTTSDLQSVLSYTGIYANWDVDVDGTTGNDDPWDFGTNMQYPRLKFDGMSLTAQGRSTPTDYDDNDNGLIDVTTLAQLNAMRWDLNGDGDVSSTNAANYLLAFPNRNTNSATRMGCPSGTCTGYELRADLDFDTDDDGDVDSSDTYSNWTPIGTNVNPYATEFKGNNRTISNLTISGSSTLSRIGLFGALSSTSTITGVGLVDVNINVSMSNTGASFAGALVGYNTGTVRSTYATGSVSATTTGTAMNVGGLAGTTNSATIAASWASVDVSSSGSANYAGGLTGWLQGSSPGSASIIGSYATGSVSATDTGSINLNNHAGGLVGYAAGSGSEQAIITASYATGPVSAPTSGSSGGLVGTVISGTTITDAYWDAGTTDIADDADTTSPEGKTTSDLHSVTSYTGIYANWNVNVDGMAGNDDPWEFGANMQYPLLKFDGMSQVAQGSLAMGTPGTNGDNPVVGQLAQVCLVAGPSQRAAGMGSNPKAWDWSKSTDGVSWTDIADDGDPTYEYTPVSGDVGSYLRACVDLDTTLSAVEGAEVACVHPFAKVKASN